MKITPELLAEIKNIVDKHHAVFVADVLGHQALDPEILAALKAEGLVGEGEGEEFELAYVYGQLVSKLQDPTMSEWDAAKIKAELKANPIPLTDAETRAQEAAKLRAAFYVRGLGNVVAKETGQILIEADAQARWEAREKIRGEVRENVAARKTVKQLKSRLGHALGDWARNLDRVAITEKHNAMQEGVADGLRKRYGPEGRVFIRAMPDACKWCKKLHTGPDGAPRIFRLSQLAPPGANVGKKAADWVPTVGSVHPHCHPPGTLVETARGRVPIESVEVGDLVPSHQGRWRVVTHVWESDYSGPVVTVVGAGWEVRATDNHPLLTTRGWRLAGEIESGDEVIGVDPGSRFDLDAHDPPTDGREESFLATVSFGLDGRGVPIAAVDLQGDLFLWKREVDQERPVVRQDRESGNGVQTPGRQQIVDLALDGGFKPTALTDDGVLDLGGRSLAPAYRRMGPGDVGEALLRCESGRANSLRLARRAWLDAQGQESSADGVPGDPEVSGHRLYRVSRVKATKKDGVVYFGSDDHGGSVEGFGTVTRKVLSVDASPFSGRVFNLTVTGDHSYIANGVFSHNCQCQVSRVPVGWGFDEQGTLVPGGEFGVEYEGGDLTKALAAEDAHWRSMIKAHRLEGSLRFRGLDVAVETGPGGLRFWRDGDESGVSAMAWPYGYIRGTLGVDGDEVDCFVGPDPNAAFAYVVHQRRKTDSGFSGYDEDKVMLGFSSAAAAREAYLIHYDDPGFFGSMSTWPIDDLKAALKTTIKKPRALRKSRGPALVIPDTRGPRIQNPDPVLEKGQPFIGPRGGKYADARLTIPWKEPRTPRPDVKRLLAGGLGIPRPDMPQIRSDLVPKFLETLSSMGVGHRRQEVRARDLRPTQLTLHVQKIRDQMARPLEDIAAKPIIVSSDGHVLDGHHRWAALRTLDPDSRVRAIVVDLPIRKLLDAANAFEDVEFKKSGAGHKYLSRKRVRGRWVYEYAKEYGGKVSGHKSDPTKVTLKLPKAKAGQLAALAEKYGLEPPVVGSKYAMVFVPKATPEPEKKSPQKAQEPVTPPVSGPFDPGALAQSLSGATGLSVAEIRDAVTGPADPLSEDGAKRAEVRARLQAALLSQGLERPDAVTEILGPENRKRVKEFLSGVVKGDLDRAVKEFGDIPVYDLRVLSRVKLVPKKFPGRAQAHMTKRSIRIGLGSSGDYVTGDFRHELGHVVHAAEMLDPDLEAAALAHFKQVQKRRKATPQGGPGKMDSNWYEENWGVTGKRGADNHQEDQAEHYRVYHRTLRYQTKGATTGKGSLTLDVYRQRHPEMARRHDARYTLALMDAWAQEGKW